jgi:hypothetical protein
MHAKRREDSKLAILHALRVVHGAMTGCVQTVESDFLGCTPILEVISMSEEYQYPELRRRIRRYPNLFEPKEEDIWEVVGHLKRRMDIYELEHLVREMPLEDVVKALLLRGYPLAYISREIRETRETRTEGLIFKHPVETSSRYIRELRIFSGGYGYEPDTSST